MQMGMSRSVVGVVTEVLPVTPSPTAASPKSPESDEPGGIRKDRKVVWQWEHRTGFKDYEPQAIDRIERAFQKGDSMVRLRSGKGGSIPMEVFFHDMLQHDPVSGNTRKVRRIGPQGLWHKTRRWIAEVARSLETGRPRKVMFSQYQEHRHNLYKNLDKGIVLSTDDPLEDKTWWAKLVLSHEFFIVSMSMVVLNMVWIVVDAEFNEAATIWEADLPYRVMEYVFCTFFTLELGIRFRAFERKRECLRDWWFVFDTILVASQVTECVILPFIVAGQRVHQSLGYLRVARLLRLARLGRIFKMLHLFPEVLMLLRGITRALKSVCTTLMMLVVLLLIFAIIFKTQSNDDDAMRHLFPSILDAIWLLLMRGTFLDSPSVAFYEIYDKSVTLACVFVLFIFLSSFTVLNMLIGILCDVVCQVSQMEKDDNAVSFLKTTLLDLLECYDKNEDRHLGLAEFELLMVNPEMHLILERFDVDAGGLSSLKDILFEQVEKEVLVGEDEDGSQIYQKVKEERDLSFGEFLQVVLRLRGQNNATVMDIVDLREYVRKRLDRLDKVLPDLLVAASPQATPRASLTASPRNTLTAFSQKVFAQQLSEKKVAREASGERAEISELRDEVRELRQQLKRLLPVQPDLTPATTCGTEGPLALTPRAREVAGGG